MLRNAGIGIGVAALTLLIGDSAPSSAATAEQGRRAPASLCARGETPLFQCRIGSKMVAVCGGRSAGRTYAQYRYGRPGALELQYPANKTSGAGTMVQASIPFSGGGEAQFHFTNAGHQYLIYSRTVRTGFGDQGNNPEFSAGVAVRRNGRTLSNRGCSDGDSANVDLGAAEPFIPAGEQLDFDH